MEEVSTVCGSGWVADQYAKFAIDSEYDRSTHPLPQTVLTSSKYDFELLRQAVKPLRQISIVTLLSLTLAISAMAGQVESPGAPAPAPPTMQTTSTTTSILLTIIGLIYR